MTNWRTGSGDEWALTAHVQNINRIKPDQFPIRWLDQIHLLRFGHEQTINRYVTL